MRVIVITCATAALVACNQSNEGQTPANTVANAAASAKPKRAPYCFFKADQTKGWKASVDASENVTVTGKGMMPDPRYKADLGQAEVEGASAIVRPIMVQNTGYRSLDNWWDIRFTIPGSGAVNAVTIKCGEKTLAELEVKRAK